MFYIKEDAFDVPANKTVLKASEYALFLQGQDIIDQAQKKAAQIIKDAEKVYEDEKQRGYQEGLDEGNLKTSELMIEAAAKSLENFEQFENEIIGIVIDSIRKIIGQMDNNDLIIRVVKKGLEMVREQKRVTLVLSPNDVTNVREQISSIIQQYPNITFIDVQSDKRSQPGMCRLMTDMGVVDASVELQIEALKKSLQKALK